MSSAGDPKRKVNDPSADDRARLGPYRIVRLVGRGGMAEVYSAEVVEGPYAGQTVAIKRLLPKFARDPEMLDRFLGEADLARLMAHPNLVEVIDAGNFRGSPYIVMEYIDGRDLAQVIHRCRKSNIDLPLPFCTHIAGRVLEALTAVHDAKGRDGTPLGVVHCDLNPGNVFISRLGVIKVGDFGVAQIGALERSELGQTRGKLSYLSPEQAYGLELDRRTDIYALGVILYELLTLDRPYVSESVEELVEAQREGGIWAPSVLRGEVPPGLDDVVRRCLEIDPAARYPDAKSVLADLAAFRDEFVGNDLAIASLVRGLFPQQ